MTGQELVELLGLSINDSKVTNAMKLFNLSKPELWGYASQTTYNDADGIAIYFRPRVVFEREYLEPPHTLVHDFSIRSDRLDPNSESMEFFIECITFYNTFTENLPFGLKADDKPETFMKLGKSLSKEKYNDRYLWYFITEKYRILVSLDKNKTLEYIAVWPIDNNIRRILKRKATIKIQNKNIKPLMDSQIDLLKDEKPTILWKERMADGDDIFNEENLQQSEILLDLFINSIQVASTEKKANKILSATKAIVVGFNKLNKKYGHIETLEREELCLFIDNAIKATGFEIEENDDLTLEWRQW